MGIYRGPGVVNEGLVFGYDTGYPISDNTVTNRFNQGEPSTNLVSAYNDNHVRHVTWTNSGTWEYNHNATNNTKPIIPGVDMSKCNLMHGKTVTTGSQHFGCGSVSVSGSTTYSMSVYYFQNKAGISQPYFRTSVNNNNLGNLAYNGSTDTNSWPVNEWIRISVTVTVQSNETGCYLSNYIGSAVGDQVWYCAPMVEQADQTTPFVDGTRSVTASLIDLKRTTSIDVGDVSFDSNAQPTFDGTDDFLTVPSYSGFTVDTRTVEIIFKMNGSYSNFSPLAVYANGSSSSNRIWLGLQNSQFQMHGWGTVDPSGSTTIAADTWYVCTFSYNKSTQAMKVYTNGVLESSVTNTQGGVTAVSGMNWYLATVPGGWQSVTYSDVDIPSFKIYDRILSDAEVAQNFNAYKNRFNI